MTDGEIEEAFMAAGSGTPRSAMDWFVLTLRLLTGVMFLVTGAQKAFISGPAAFAQDIVNYHILMEPWPLVTAYVMPWLEMAAGGCLLGGFLLPGALALTQGMTVLFMLAIGQALYRGIDLNCGCFGHSEGTSNLPLHLAGLVLLLAVLLLIQLWPGSSTAKIDRKRRTALTE